MGLDGLADWWLVGPCSSRFTVSLSCLMWCEEYQDFWKVRDRKGLEDHLGVRAGGQWLLLVVHGGAETRN